MKIKTNDSVQILKGRDKGKVGKVTQVFPELNKVVVEGVNKATKHLKKRGTTAGQKIEFTAPIRVENVALVGKGGPGRVGYKFIEKDGKRHKIRILHTKKGTEDID